LQRPIEQHARVPPQAAKPEVAILGGGGCFEHPILIRRALRLALDAALVRSAHVVVILPRILSCVD